MRTIKFRGKVEYPQKYFGDKDIPNGRWIVGDLHLNWCYPHIHIDTKDKYPINPNTVGQFTGLHDKNGKEIYEGDIVKHLSYAREEVGYIGFHARSAAECLEIELKDISSSEYEYELIRKSKIWFQQTERYAARLTSGNVSHLGCGLRGFVLRSREYLIKHRYNEDIKHNNQN